MNKQITFSPHIVALAAIFVLGNGVIGLPLKGSNEFSFTAYIISLVIMGFLYFTVSYLWDKINFRYLGVVIFGICIAALFCAAQTFTTLVSFVSQVILPSTPNFFIAVVLAVTAVYFSLKRQESLLKFSLVSVVLVIGVVIFFFIAPMDKYDLRNIFVFRLPKWNEIALQIKPYVVNPVIHSLLLPVYLKFVLGKTRTKHGLLGVIFGGVLLGMCILAPILLFGANLSGSLEFPFSSAVSTVTVGRLFTRLDGFAYFVYFVTSLIKITICMSIVFSGLKEINLSFSINKNTRKYNVDVSE